jgi:hypothetical protein
MVRQAATVCMSAIGTKLTCRAPLRMSAIGTKPDLRPTVFGCSRVASKSLLVETRNRPESRAESRVSQRRGVFDSNYGDARPGALVPACPTFHWINAL